MAVSDEDQRLLAYEAQRARMPERDRARRAALSGDPEAKRQFDERWAPLQKWLAENGSREEGGAW